MTTVIPTKNGDIVISHFRCARFTYLIWPVTADGEQRPHPRVSTIATTGHHGALQSARRLANETRGTVFLVDFDSGAWAALAG